ncbi:MAG: hypothetical protein EA426_00785 [Spirochaetaceae bacterium]|nr:MAG: hypothetical protein EA426_00785 [Spirochaetaceae bacterium]
MATRDNRSPDTSGVFYTWRVYLSARDRIDARLAEHLGEYRVTVEPDGSTLLSGELPDLSAAFGLVLTLRDWSVQPVSVHIERRRADGGGDE